jgi:hypothetical protein
MVFPYVSKELIEELNNRFPQRSPEWDESYEHLMWRGGQRSVVEFLTTICEEQDLASTTG